MNWRDILKNQIASTKGKTFQLDFNQPMIEEEEDCKRRFQEVLNKLRNLTISGFKREKKNDYEGIPYEYYYHTKPNTLEEMVEIFLRFKEGLPNEIYCKAIEQYENTAIGQSKLKDYGEYRVLTENRTVATRRSSEEGENFDNNNFEVSIYLLDTIGKEEAKASIFVRQRILYDGRYGNKGKTNPKLDDKVEQIIQGALVF